MVQKHREVDSHFGTKPSKEKGAGGQLGDVAEDDREGQGGEEGLDQVPQRAEDGLLVDRHEVAPHEEHHQVAVLPQFTQAQVEQAALRLDDHVPCFLV